MVTVRRRGLGVLLKLLRLEPGTLLFTLLLSVVLRERGFAIEGLPCISTMLMLVLPRLLFPDKLSPRVNRELRTEKLLSRAASHQPAES